METSSRVNADVNAWFAGFAPFNDPEIAIIVLVENGGHGYYTATTARAIFESYFGTNEEITKSTPEKSLLVSLSKTGGRNSSGQITCRHIGGGHKRKYRVIDFKRNKDNVPGKVAAIEYDPNRTANIALICYAD